MSAPTDAETLARAHVSRSVEAADAHLHHWVTRLGYRGLVAAIERGEDVPERWVLRHRSLEVPTDAVIRLAARRGVTLLVPGDLGWPEDLDDLGVRLGLPVPCLWVRGRLPPAVPETPPVAVVGSRAASPYGVHVATDLAHELARRGHPVVSGAAIGIDAAAHRGALSGQAHADPDEPGATVAVLGCGVDVAYPRSNSRLLERIAASGAVVSEQPPGAVPYPWRFPPRNRIIAALARATVVVEAGQRSGALGTARAAEQLGRVVCGVPGSVHSAGSRGVHDLLRGPGVDLVTCADDVVELVAPLGSVPVREAEAAAGDTRADVLRDRVRRCVIARPRGIDDIAARCGLDVADVRSVLLGMEADGLVRQERDGWRRVSPASGEPRV